MVSLNFQDAFSYIFFLFSPPLPPNINNIENNINNIEINLKIDKFDNDGLLFGIPYILNLNNIIKNANTAVFGVLPPESSGIANYNAKTFGINSNFHVFSNFSTPSNFKTSIFYIEKKFQNNFIPIEYYNNFFLKYNYLKYIFILGNSSHNTEYLRYAIKENNKEKSYLYLHEINLLYLLLSFVHNNKNEFINLIAEYYGKEKIFSIINESDNIHKIIKSLFENKIYGARIIISFTEIHNIIVNNDNAYNLLLYDIQNFIHTKVNIIKMFLPIENLMHIIPKYSKSEDIIYIGSFGIPNDFFKSTDTIIKAVYILNNEYKKYNKKIVLLLAGYGVKEYINSFSNKELLKNIVYYDSPEIDELFSIMMSSEISIQLRNSPHGETSGIICQLLGMGKKIIVTDNILPFDEAKYFCRSVKKNITANELALEITSFLDKKINIKPKEILDIYSFEKLSSDISFL